MFKLEYIPLYWYRFLAPFRKICCTVVVFSLRSLLVQNFSTYTILVVISKDKPDPEEPGS